MHSMMAVPGTRTMWRAMTVALVVWLTIGLVGQTSQAHAYVPAVLVAPSVMGEIAIVAKTGAAAVSSGVALAPIVVGAALIATGGLLIRWGATGNAPWDWDTADPAEGGVSGFSASCSYGNTSNYFLNCGGGSFNRYQYWVADLTGAAPNQTYRIHARYVSDDRACSPGPLMYTDATGVASFSGAFTAGSNSNYCTDGAVYYTVNAGTGTSDGTAGTSAGSAGDNAPSETYIASIASRANCTHPTTLVTSTASARSMSYDTSDAPPPIPAVNCPAGTTLMSMTATREISSPSGVAAVNLVEYVSPLTLEPVTPLNDCFTGGCELVLEEDLDANTEFEPCAGGDTKCVGWATNPDAFRCVWGVNLMPLADCEMFHEPGKADPGVDSNLDTSTDRGTQTQTVPDAEGELSDGCGNFSVLNPFSSIAKGFGCALEWAFIPSTDTMARLEQSGQTVTGKAPFSYLAQGQAFVADIGEVSSTCFEWAFTMPAGWLGQPAEDAGVGETPIKILDTCNPGPVETFFIEKRGILTSMLYVGFFMPLLWWAWRTYAPGTTSAA
jgi:hypothetical protein